MPEDSYVLFCLERAELSCRFLCPAGWNREEIAEPNFLEIYIQKPRDPSESFGIFMVVRVYWAAPETPQEASEKLLSQYRTGKDYRELGQATGTVAGYPAMEVEFAWKMLFPFHSIHAQWTPLRERHVFFKRKKDLWELYCAAAEEAYPPGLEAFRILVQSFAFQDTETSGGEISYCPVIDVLSPVDHSIEKGKEKQ